MKYKIYSSKYLGINPEPINPEFIELDMLMQKGYGYELDGDIQNAIRCWNNVFDEIVVYFDKNHLKDLVSFDDLFNGTQYVQNWVQDYDDVLRQALLDEDVKTKELNGNRKIKLLGFLLSLTSNDKINIHNYKRSLAETHYLLGMPEVGELLYVQLIEYDPDNVWGYVGYADEYWLGSSKFRDLEKAFAILSKAYHRQSIKRVISLLNDLCI